MYLKLNEATLRKQGSLNEVRGFLPIPKNGIDKHMTHHTVKGPHTASELKEMDDESNGERKNDKNPWILRDKPKDPQIIREIMGRVMEVNTISLFGNFAKFCIFRFFLFLNGPIRKVIMLKWKFEDILGFTPFIWLVSI